MCKQAHLPVPCTPNFKPTQAFEAFAQKMGFSSVEDMAAVQPLAQAVVGFHLLPGPYSMKQILDNIPFTAKPFRGGLLSFSAAGDGGAGAAAAGPGGPAGGLAEGEVDGVAGGRRRLGGVVGGGVEGAVGGAAGGLRRLIQDLQVNVSGSQNWGLITRTMDAGRSYVQVLDEVRGQRLLQVGALRGLACSVLARLW